MAPANEIDRAKALLFDLQQQAAVARGNWRVASAPLTRVLRLNPMAVVVPIEPPHLQVALFSPGVRVADLVPIGLTNRPELASQRALVQAGVERVRQERFRPFIPNVLVEGAGPGGCSTARSSAADPTAPGKSTAAVSTWTWESSGP